MGFKVQPFFYLSGGAWFVSSAPSLPLSWCHGFKVQPLLYLSGGAWFVRFNPYFTSLARRRCKGCKAQPLFYLSIGAVPGFKSSTLILPLWQCQDCKFQSLLCHSYLPLWWSLVSKVQPLLYLSGGA